MSIEEREAELLALIPRRRSAEELAQMLGARSRNVIIGFCQRNGISLRHGKISQKRVRYPYSTREVPNARSTPELDEYARQFLASLPEDTRDNTGRLLGDPIFERSALYAKRTREGMR